jgi:hypothetical protein
MRHVHGSSFIAHVDDADAVARDMIPNRLDVSALQSEDAVDTPALEESRNPCRGAVLAGAEILR